MLIFTQKLNTCLEFPKATRLKVEAHFLVLIPKQLYAFILKLWIEQVANGINIEIITNSNVITKKK